MWYKALTVFGFRKGANPQGKKARQKRKPRPHQRAVAGVQFPTSTTVVIFCWHICLISESMGHHDSEIMDDGSID